MGCDRFEVVSDDFEHRFHALGSVDDVVVKPLVPVGGKRIPHQLINVR